MSKKNKQALRRLAREIREIRENTPRIKRKLAKAGVKPDPALVFSAAKYYHALNKLARS